MNTINCSCKPKSGQIRHLSLIICCVRDFLRSSKPLISVLSEYFQLLWNPGHETGFKSCFSCLASSSPQLHNSCVGISYPLSRCGVWTLGQVSFFLQQLLHTWKMLIANAKEVKLFPKHWKSNIIHFHNNIY